MLDIGWSEMLVIAVVMIVVVGPKDLPKMLRTFGKFTAKLRGMAGDFQKQFNEAMREAELDDVKKSVDTLRSLNPANEIKKQLNPFERAAAEIRSSLDSTPKPAPKPDAGAEARPAEPLKAGAAPIPGVNGPAAMPEPPVLEPATPPKPAEAPAAGQPAPAVAATASASNGPVAAAAKPAKPRAAKKATPSRAAPAAPRNATPRKPAS